MSKAVGKRYGTEEVQRALVFVAAANGNTRQAARDLKRDGMKVTPQTLRRWVKANDGRDYERVRQDILPALAAAAAERHRAIADRDMEISLKMSERLEKEMDQIPARDLPGGIRNMGTNVGIHRDKAQLLSGEPTERIEKTGDEVIRSIKARLGQLGKEPPETIDGEATEEPVATIEKSGEGVATAA